MLRNAPIISIIMSFSLSSLGSENMDRLASELLQVRNQVEVLQESIEENKQNHQSELQSLNVMKADLSASNQRDRMQFKQLSGKLEKLREELKRKFEGESDLSSFTSTQIQSLKTYVSQSLPFKKTERLKILETIQANLESEKLSQFKATNRLWSFIEDEFRLQQDVGIYQQIISINGEEKLCEVAKIGMIAFLVKSPEEKYGILNLKKQSWAYTEVEQTNQIEYIENFFDSLKKQIRVGSFKLPNFI